MAIATFGRAMICAMVLAIPGCGRGPIEAKSNPNHSQTSGAEAVAGTSGEVRQYVARFTTKNPDACFGKVELQQPVLEAASGSIGPRVPPTRVIVMIDGSGSMAGRIGTKTKLDLARLAAGSFVDGLPPSVQTSLLVFGQQGDNSEAGKAKSCSAVDVTAPMSLERAGFRAALAQVRAVGWTPLAAALDRAEVLLEATSTPGEQIIYVVSDGEETCGGDPVASARRINAGRTRAIINVIGFNLPSEEAAKLTAVAQAGGGGFVNLSSAADLARLAAEVREAIRRTDNEVKTSIATTDNRVATSIAITDAETCISNLATDEYVAMSRDLADREVAGRPVSFSDEAKALLKARHDDLRAQVRAYRARLSDAETGARQNIDAEAVAAR